MGLGAVTPTEFAVLKGQEMQLPQESEKPADGLLTIGGKLGSTPQQMTSPALR
jgi:hypothetical protein